MFAGIEDEQLANIIPDNKIPKKSHICLDNYINSVTGNTVAHNLLLNNSLKYDTSVLTKSPFPTKAAKKSAISLPNFENTKEINMLFTDSKNTLIPKSKFYLKTVAPRRRLSIGISKEFLECSVNIKDEVENNTASNIMMKDHKIPLSLNLPTHRNVKEVKKNVLNKNKIRNNSQKKCSVYTKKLTDMASNNRTNKRKIPKLEASNKARQSQKIKYSQLQRPLFSENDTDEKQLPTKDCESKNRSPFILIKNNGNIAVVNAVTLDDCNEKFMRSKKFSKTVKGCHSSTLSNRYDADTADSSWKCVFCKLGPHKKGLGDLFGPYIISSDCDEYRSIEDALETFQGFRRNDSQFFNYSQNPATSISETCNSNKRNISECKYDRLINIYTLGMTQVSPDCYEIWIHEECAVWAPKIFVVGSRLAGLEEASWNGIRYECVHCFKQGALLCCLQRDCKSTSHVPCAREFNWLLNESKFWVYCKKHSLTQSHLNKI